MSKDQGLMLKYRISKWSGDPVDPNGKYFVLRYDKNDTHGDACRAALRTYAENIKGAFPLLAEELTAILNHIESRLENNDAV